MVDKTGFFLSKKVDFSPKKGRISGFFHPKMVEKTGFFLSKNVDYFSMKGRKSVFSLKKGRNRRFFLPKKVEKLEFDSKKWSTKLDIFYQKKWIYLQKNVEKVNNH